LDRRLDGFQSPSGHRGGKEKKNPFSSLAGNRTPVILTEISRLSELSSSSFLGSTAQLRPWPPPQNRAEFLGGFSTIFFLQGRVVPSELYTY
jgi:hypothetical protein